MITLDLNAFNSLFEMRGVAVVANGAPVDDKLSILYLRCHGRTRGRRPQGGETFQFSI